MARILLEELFRKISSFILLISVAILVCLVSAVSLEIVLRGFFNHSLSWIHETATLLAAWFYFLGIVVVYHNSRDISVSLVVNRFHGRVRAAIERLHHLVAGGVYLWVAYESWRLVQIQWPFSTPGVGFPRMVFTLPLVVGCALIGLECLSRTVFLPQPRRTSIASTKEV